MKKIHLTVHKENKLEGIVSINTSSLCNDFCNKMANRKLKRKDRKGDIICHYCYSEKNEVIYKALEAKLIYNSKLLSEQIMEPQRINAAYVRFSSFGELINDIHMENLFNIAKNNPKTTFCLMTKRYDLVMKFPKLKNVVYIASSPMINKKIENEEILNYFDKTFTVYSKDFDIEKNKIKINCGVNGGCMQCGLCYNKKGVKSICEILRK